MTFRKRQSGTVENVEEVIFVTCAIGMMKFVATVVSVVDQTER